MTTTALTEIAEQELFTVSELREKELARLDLVAIKAKTALDIEIVDKKTYDIVHDAQMECQKNRTRLSKGRLLFTESLTKQTKEAIQCEKDLIARIEPTEQALKAKKEAYEAEQARIKAEKEAQAMKILEERNNELLSYGVVTPLETLKAMSDDGFRMMADMWKKKWEESEKIRLEQEAEAEKKRQEELEEMRKFRADQEKIAEDNRKQSEELAQKQKMIDDKENEMKRQDELKQAQESARLQAIEDEKARVESERLRKIAEDQAEKERTEKEQGFKNWLIENGVTPENKDQFEVRNSEPGKKVLWKKISTYQS